MEEGEVYWRGGGEGVMMEGRIIETDRQRGRKQRDERNEEGAGVMEMDGGDRGG